MPKNTIYHKTEHENIYWYDTKDGKRFHVRINYKKVNGKRSEKTKSGLINISVAKRARTELQSVIDRNEIKLFDADKVTFRMLYEIYLKVNASRWEAGTLKNAKKCWELYLSRFENIKPTKPWRSTYVEFINELLYEKDLSLTYVQGIHSCAMGILNNAVDDEILPSNKLRNIKIEKLELPKQKHLELDLITKLDILAKRELDPVQYACYLLMRAGIRRGEISALTFEDINVVSDEITEITINKSMTEDGKIKKPKTQNSYRTIEFNGYRARIFANWLKVAKGRYWANNEPFTPQSSILLWQNGRLYTYYLPCGIMKFLSLKLGLEKPITPHMLRHTFASHAKDEPNIFIGDIAEWLGNTPRTVLKVYAASTDKSKSEIKKFANS